MSKYKLISAKWIIENNEPTYKAFFIGGPVLIFNRSWLNSWAYFHVVSAMETVRSSILPTELQIRCTLK